MKKTLFFILLFLVLPQPLLANTISDYSPVAHWTCDEFSGVRYDSTSNINHLTDNNTVSTTTGLLNTACDFTKTNSEYLSITDADQTNLDFTSSFSISFWAKFDSFTNWRDLFGKWQATTGQQGPTQAIIGSNNNDEIVFYIGTGGTWPNKRFGNLYLNTAQWYHVVFVYDSTVPNVYLYIDSVSKTVTGSYLTIPSTPYDSVAPFQIARSNHSSTDYNDITIDEFSVFNYPLSSTQVTELYNSGTPLPYEEEPTINISMCVYANIYDMNSVIGQTCSTNGATTTCTYDLSPTTTAVQVTSGDIVFGLALILFILFLTFVAFIIKPFKSM